MFDDLDDPLPFEPSPELIEGAKARGRRRRARRRLAMGGVAAPVVLVVLALVATVVYVDRKVDDVQRVDVGSVVTAVAPGAPFNLLLVGVDGPYPLDTQATGGRADTIVVVHVDPSQPHLTLLPIPRDLVFDGAASSAERLSQRFADGGPTALIDAIETHLGLPISHYVAMDFDGFVHLVDAAGGLSVAPSLPVRDTRSGLRLDAGCQRIDGAQALSLARSRYLEFQLDSAGDRWQADTTSSVGRTDRQGLVVSQLFRQLRSRGVDPGAVASLLDVFVTNTTVDSSLDRATMLGLIGWARGLDDDAIRAATLPVEVQYVGPAAVQVMTSDVATVTAAFTNGEVVSPPTTMSGTASPPMSIVGC